MTSPIPADFLLTGARQLVTPLGNQPLRGAQQGHVTTVADAAVAARQGRIVFVGPAGEARRRVVLEPGALEIDGTGYTVVPGFVDPHTHAVYAGDRRDELHRRLAGATYADIAATGGGIVSTVKATREATEQDLVVASLPRLREMLRCGTTACEIKSGYGLDTESELRMLRSARALATLQPIDIVTTMLGAHEIPIEWRHDRRAYVRLVIDEMIPRAAAEGLAEWCDVFCETGAFTPEESEAVLRAGVRHGLRARVHADELAASGGSQVAARVGARSADHLVHADEGCIRALRDAGVVATLLPAAAFYLKLGRFAPARDLIAAGVPVALASDINPGGGFSPSMPFAMTLACFAMGMTVEEALVAATLNAAGSIDLADRIGTVEPGKLCDLVLVDGDLVDLLRVGADAVATVVKRGQVVCAQKR
jgi:imidazolonepropionase